MSKCSLSNQVFEIKNFVCEFYWIAVSKVDFQLTSATFIGASVNIKSLSLDKVVYIVNHCAKFSDFFRIIS